MNKGIELTKSQIKAYENGATMFLFPTNISERIIEDKETTDMFILSMFQIQKTDKDIFIKEPFKVTNHHKDHFIYEYEMREYFTKQNIFKDASQMAKEQSRYSFSECIDNKIKKVQDLGLFELAYLTGRWLVGASSIAFCREQKKKFVDSHFRDFYNEQMREKNIDRTYDDNDYIFLVEFKR